MTVKELIELLAKEEHDSWADYVDYLINKFPRAENGDVILPAAYVAALEKQVATDYQDLSEPEKEADRREVQRWLPHALAYAAQFKQPLDIAL